MRRRVPLFLAFALAAIYAGRAAVGVPRAAAFARGSAAAAEGRFAEALRGLEQGGVGSLRSEALWLAAQVHLGAWDIVPAAERASPRATVALSEAARDFLAAGVEAPTTGGWSGGLAEVYRRRERARRSTVPLDLASLSWGPWERLGDDGRIAIGLTRRTIERLPNEFLWRDALVILLEENGLRDEALAAMRESARVLPDFGPHPDFDFERMPRPLVEAFYDASREAVGSAPFMLRERHLLSLGLLARRLGRLDEAERHLREALESPGSAAFHAEDAFHLAWVLIDTQRYEDAERYLEHAESLPVFREGVASARASVAIRHERWQEALGHLETARRLAPRRVDLCLAFADVAARLGAWDRALESLAWASVIAPDDPLPRARIVDIYLQSGDRVRATAAFHEFQGRFGPSAETTRLAAALAAEP